MSDTDLFLNRFELYDLTYYRLSICSPMMCFQLGQGFFTDHFTSDILIRETIFYDEKFSWMEYLIYMVDKYKVYIYEDF